MKEWISSLKQRIGQTLADARVVIIIIIALIILAFTGLAWAFGWWQQANDFNSSIFASWIAGVFLFIATGIGVAVVTLARPESDDYHSRARILFQRKSGLHIDYIVDRVREILEHFSESTETSIILEEYNEGAKKFRLIVNSSTSVRSYIDDIETKYLSTISYKDVTAPPSVASAKNRVVSLKLDESVIVSNKEFVDCVEHAISYEIKPSKALRVESCTTFWFEDDRETYNFSPKRYTQKFRLYVENRTELSEVTIQLIKGVGADWGKRSLSSGDRVCLVDMADLLPEKRVFSLRFCSGLTS